MATFRGTAKRDILKGTAANDTILGLVGNVFLTGKGGKDTLSYEMSSTQVSLA